MKPAGAPSTRPAHGARSQAATCAARAALVVGVAAPAGLAIRLIPIIAAPIPAADNVRVSLLRFMLCSQFLMTGRPADVLSLAMKDDPGCASCSDQNNLTDVSSWSSSTMPSATAAIGQGSAWAADVWTRPKSGSVIKAGSGAGACGLNSQKSASCNPNLLRRRFCWTKIVFVPVKDPRPGSD